MLFVLSLSTQGQDVRERYAGKSGCQPELRWAPGTYSIRLEKDRRTRLSAYTVGHRNLLFIIQYADDQDKCGVIRDVVQPKDSSSSFVWDCWDPRDKQEVVVGTWPSEHPGVSGPAVEAWKIGGEGLRFVPFSGGAKCFAGSYAGADGGDLVTLAKKRRSNGKK